MRRQEKKAILHLVSSFRGTLDELKKSISNNDISETQNFLSICQDAAVHVGSSIEESEGEGTQAVLQLEKYCEIAYVLFQKINRNEAIDAQKEISQLQSIIDGVEDFIRNSIVTKSEIVFFPYKASMWDSLESIWRAASADTRVETYVVPIPYFDRNPDGAAGEMHYEGDLFPDDVPVISYLDYDVKKRHPDDQNSYKYLITDGNKLFVNADNNYQYKYLTDLSDYIVDGWYTYAVEINGLIYCCGFNAQDIVVVQDGKVIKKIEFKDETSRSHAFYSFHVYDSCIYLIPDTYDSIVKYDTFLDEVTYYDGYKVAFCQNVYGQHLLGGTCIYKNYLLLASPTNHDVLAFDLVKESFSIITTDDSLKNEEKLKEINGSNALIPDEKDGCVWLLPYMGTEIRRWYPESGMVQVYDKFPNDFMCYDFPGQNLTSMLPFSSAAISDRYVVLAPAWGNRILKLNKESGEISIWEPGLKLPEKPLCGYYNGEKRTVFISPVEVDKQDSYWLLFSYYDRTLYKVNIDTDEMTEIPITFD